MKKALLITKLLFAIGSTFAQSWMPIGNGVNGDVQAIAVYNGELYVAGGFDAPAPQLLQGLLKWNGVAFDTVPGSHLLGTARIWALQVFNNELYLGGSFCTICNPVHSAFDYVAKWNGTMFSRVGTGINGQVFALAAYNGALYAGGDMSMIDTTTVNGIAKWDGNNWQALDSGINVNGRVFDLQVYQNELYASGGFWAPAINSTVGIARWNGTSWNEVGPGGINGNVSALGLYNGELYAGGNSFTQAGGVPVNQLAKWNGTTWAACGGGFGSGSGGGSAIETLWEFNSRLYAGGEFQIMDGDSLKCIASYDGTDWDSLGSGVDSMGVVVSTIVIFPGDTIFHYAPASVLALRDFDGALYAGGFFNMIGGVQARNIAKWGTLTGIAPSSNGVSISAFPNPASDAFQFVSSTIESGVSMQLVDPAGHIVHLDLDFKGQPIDVRHLPNGIYTLHFYKGKSRNSRKIVVQH